MSNKYQEALLKLLNSLNKSQFIKYGRDCEIVLQELVDKETPKKTTKEVNEHYDYDYYCPNCKGNVNRFNKYCKNCGQRIDWSE